MSKTSPITDILNAITIKTPHEYRKKEFPAYMIMMFMSEDRELQDIVAAMNPYLFNVPDELVFKYFVKAVPKGKRFIKYTKKSEAAKDRIERIKEMATNLNISKREASYSVD